MRVNGPKIYREIWYECILLDFFVSEDTSGIRKIIKLWVCYMFLLGYQSDSWYFKGLSLKQFSLPLNLVEKIKILLITAI